MAQYTQSQGEYEGAPESHPLLWKPNKQLAQFILIQKRGMCFIQVSLTFLVRPSFHSSIAQSFILEWLIPIFIQLSLI